MVGYPRQCKNLYNVIRWYAMVKYIILAIILAILACVIGASINLATLRQDLCPYCHSIVVWSGEYGPQTGVANYIIWSYWWVHVKIDTDWLDFSLSLGSVPDFVYYG